MVPTLLSYLLCWPGTPVLLACTRAAREPGYVVWSGPLLPPTQPPLPVTCHDCWPIEEPFESVRLAGKQSHGRATTLVELCPEQDEGAFGPAFDLPPAVDTTAPVMRAEALGYDALEAHLFGRRKDVGAAATPSFEEGGGPDP